MEMPRNEIDAELEHKKRVLVALIRRRRPLEIQEATKGDSTPAEVLTEINTLSERIQTQQEEITKLETKLVEDQLSLSEAEYRLILAKAWSTPRGSPTVVGQAELELTRLKMRLDLTRAQQIECEIRRGLAEEAFSELSVYFSRFLPDSPKNPSKIVRESGITYNIQVDGIFINSQDQRNARDVMFNVIGRAIRLDSQKALQLFIEALPSDFQLDFDLFRLELLALNRVWNFQEDMATFNNFLESLENSLKLREIERGTSNQL